MIHFWKGRLRDPTAGGKRFLRFCHFGVHQVFFKSHHPIDGSPGGDLDDPVRHGGEEFMVVGGEQHHFREDGEGVVQGCESIPDPGDWSAHPG